MTAAEEMIQETLRTVFEDSSLHYDKSHFVGGLTNYNYFMRIHDKGYIIREPGLLTERMIDRAAEYANHQLIAPLGINSECIYFDTHTGMKICEQIPNAQSFAALGPGSEDCLHEVARLLRNIHTQPAAFANRFDWAEELTKYETIAHDVNGQLFSDYDSLKAQLLTLMAPLANQLQLCPCHNDTVPENFLCNTEAQRSYLIDWEYSGLNDPAWDIAMYIIECHLDAEEIRHFLFAYYGQEPPPALELAKIRCLILAQDLLWSVWALARHYSGEDFLDYFSNRYTRFRRNLHALTNHPDLPIAEMTSF